MTVLPDWMQPRGALRLGISACLLGQAVRWDGADSRDAYLADTLGAQVELVPVCPEVAIGLGVPRPPIHLVAAGDRPTRALRVDDPDVDVSAALRAYGRRMAAELDDLSGYVLKSGSPSCGLERVKLYRPGGGRPARRGTGLYAEALHAAHPELPLEEDGRLGDAALRDAFIERVFVYRRWRALLAAGLTRSRLAEFHRRHRVLLRAHGARAAQRLERLVAPGSGLPPSRLGRAYGAGLAEALRRPASRAGHAAALRHLLGPLRPALAPDDAAEVAERIAAYRNGEVPRLVPLTLLQHHARRHPHPAVTDQLYLHPEPLEQRLRWGA